MEFWMKKENCTGCGACSNVCPQNAITMAEDDCGFKYPIINKDKCINCGLCKKTCPIINKFSTERYDSPKTYASWSKDENNRFCSTSGGIFTEIAKKIISEKGFVVGAKYNSECLVEHSLEKDLAGIEKLRQSKYLQSDTKQIYKEVKEKLIKKQLVCFCGTPCQVAGLYGYLKNDYDNLITIEFICRGVNSPKAFKSWLNEVSKNNNNKKITKVWFKYKKHGWKQSPRCTRVDFEDNTHKVYNADKNKYMYGYLNYNLYIRPSCGNCFFKSFPRTADITLADFWGIDNALDDDKGTSLILTNSNKGEMTIKSIKNNLNIYSKNVEEIFAANMCVEKSVDINPNSKEFLKSLDNNDFSKQIKKYCPKNPINEVKKKIKRLLSKKNKRR